MFVRGALPGEVVEAELTAEKKDWARAVDRRRRGAVARPGHPAVPVAAGRLRRLRLAAPHASRPSAGPGSTSSPTRCAAPAASPTRVVELGGGVEPDGYRTTIRVAAHRRRHAPGSAPSTPTTSSPRRRASSPTRRSPRCCRRCASIPASSRRCGCPSPPATWRPAGTPSAGSVRGLPDGTLLGARATLHEDVAGHRLRVSMGSFFQSGPQARRAARRRRCAGRRPSSPAPASSSTPTPASACSPSASPTRRRG